MQDEGRNDRGSARRVCAAEDAGDAADREALDADPEGMPPMVQVAVERRDALAVTLARVERGEIVLLEERGEEVAAVVPRELAVLLAQIAVEEDGTGVAVGMAERSAQERDPPPPVELLFTDLGVDEDAWAD